MSDSQSIVHIVVPVVVIFNVWKREREREREIETVPFTANKNSMKAILL